MSLVRTVGTLATEAVRTAASVARHPISTASLATGLVKGTAEAGVQLVRGRSGPRSAADVTDEVRVQEAAERATETPAPPEARDVTQPEADGPPEPQVVPKPVPEIDELPEPVVISAEEPSGEEFHTEPKAASRDSEHGGPAGDREEVEGYAEEAELVLDPPAVEPEPVWTSESTPES